MIIIGHPDIEYKPLYMISTTKDISNTPPNSTVIFKYDPMLCKYCKQNSVDFALFIKDIKEILFASAFEARFIICNKKLSKKAQKLANEYMFDTKILLLCKSEKKMLWAAKNSIDGVIFDDAILKEGF